jgi:hypothetical protein
MSPHTVEKKLKTAGVECLQRRITGFTQKRQRNAEKILMIRLQASPKSGVRVQVLGHFRQCDGQLVEFIFIEKKRVRFDAFETIVEPVSKPESRQK